MEKPDLNNPKIIYVSCLVLLLFTAIVAVSVFFIALRGGEEVMVPNVVNKELPYALIDLQNKELYPRIQLRYSQFAEERGHILEQDPKAGTIVKAGRRIRLVVSQGVLLSRVGNYVGRNLDDVQSEFKAIFGGADVPLISIKEPINYEVSSEEPGTILAQDPPPDTHISGHTELSLVVSRGEEPPEIIIPDLIGKNYDDAIKILDKAGIRYEFILSVPADTESKAAAKTFGTISGQQPPAGSSIMPGSIVHLYVEEPIKASLGEDEAAALFSYNIPENSYPMKTDLEVILPSGEREKLTSVNYKGGSFTYPYKLPKGSVIVLSILGREVYRETVQ